jgi:hypothetical protein
VNGVPEPDDIPGGLIDIDELVAMSREAGAKGVSKRHIQDHLDDPPWCNLRVTLPSGPNGNQMLRFSRRRAWLCFNGSSMDGDIRQ